MIRLRHLCLQLLLLAVIAGCGVTIAVEAERNPGADLLRYRTYCWASNTPRLAEEPGINAEVFDWRVRAAVDYELTQRGFKKTTPSTADLIVDYEVVYEQETTDTVLELYRYRMTGGPKGAQEAYTFGYEQASLVIELVDAQTERWVWHGAATAVVDTDRGSEQRVSEAVRLMFRKLM